MKELVSLLEQWNYERYVLNKSDIPILIYDQHFKELQNLEQQYNFFITDSPTQKIGRKPIGNNSQITKRKNPMLSLDSIDNYEELESWDKRIKKILQKDNVEYVCEWKIDGLSISLIYTNHKLTQISTRGDGNIGEDVTFNKRLIKDIPFTLKDICDCEIRGEVYMKKSELHQLNEELKEKNGKLLSNPRNAAAGTIRSLDSFLQRSLNFFAYQIFFEQNNKITSQVQCLQKLKKLGFSTDSDYRQCCNLAEVIEFIEHQTKKQKELDFDVDGIVIKVDNYSYYDKIGQTYRYPRWAIAYKFPSLMSYSQIQNIVTKVSRSGRITYVALINPIKISGSEISRVTLHNYSFIRKLKLGIGDEIIIKKAGSVIPQITQVIKIKKDNKWNPPEKCPNCSHILVWNKSGIYQLCNNKECTAKQINSLIHFSSRSGLNIKGIDIKIIEKLYQNNLVKKPIDFYYLFQHRDQIIKLEGFQEKTVNNVLNSIENSKQKPWSDLISALSIPLLSSVKCQKLATYYTNLKVFINALENNEWTDIEEKLGRKTQEEIKNYWENKDNQKLLRELTFFFN